MRPRNSLQQMANYNLRDRNAGSGTSALPGPWRSARMWENSGLAKRGAAKVSCRTKQPLRVWDGGEAAPGIDRRAGRRGFWPWRAPGHGCGDELKSLLNRRRLSVEFSEQADGDFGSWKPMSKV